MLRRTAIVSWLAILFLAGCQIPYFSSPVPTDRFYIVSYHKYHRHYRGYFIRDGLHRLPNGKPVMLFYNPKHRSVAAMLYRTKVYRLYDTSTRKQPLFTIRSERPLPRRTILRRLETIGYLPADFRKLGYRITVAPRRLHDRKTWLVDIDDFSNLKQRYLKAFATNDFRSLSTLPEIPKELIAPELLARIAHETSPTKRRYLMRLAKRLRIDIPTTYTERNRYDYYLFHATRQELKALIDTPKRFQRFSNLQRRTLMQRYRQLYYDYLLRQGSLDELLNYYDRHKDPTVKAKIMALIQASKSH